jgi:hypothetical protein
LAVLGGRRGEDLEDNPAQEDMEDGEDAPQRFFLAGLAILARETWGQVNRSPIDPREVPSAISAPPRETVV